MICLDDIDIVIGIVIVHFYVVSILDDSIAIIIEVVVVGKADEHMSIQLGLYFSHLSSRGRWGMGGAWMVQARRLPYIPHCPSALIPYMCDVEQSILRVDKEREGLRLR